MEAQNVIRALKVDDVHKAWKLNKARWKNNPNVPDAWKRDGLILHELSLNKKSKRWILVMRNAEETDEDFEDKDDLVVIGVCNMLALCKDINNTYVMLPESLTSRYKSLREYILEAYYN